MISLTLPCDVDNAFADPFVARLSSHSVAAVDGEHDAVLVAEDDHVRIYQLGNLNFTLPSLVDDDFNADVIFIDPAAKKAQRWIRARSRHNTLLVTERCDQLCQMCSQPPKKTHVDLYKHFETACELAPPNSFIGISGGEPTLHKHSLLGLLSKMHEVRPDLRFHVLTNAQHFDKQDIETLRTLQRVLWGVPLYAAESSLHDEIVGKQGAFDSLMTGFSILGRAGAEIELRTVIMNSNVSALNDLASLVTKSISFVDVWTIMQMENIGFARNNWNKLFYDHSKDFSLIGAPLTVALLHGVEVALYNFPLCTVPEQWQQYAARSISDWKNRFLTDCEPCPARSQCSGFFEWHPDNHGYERFGDL